MLVRDTTFPNRDSQIHSRVSQLSEILKKKYAVYRKREREGPSAARTFLGMVTTLNYIIPGCCRRAVRDIQMENHFSIMMYKRCFL